MLCINRGMQETEKTLNTVTPSEFKQLLSTQCHPVLAGCLQKDHTFFEQTAALKEVARTFADTHTVCLLSPDYLPEFSRDYAIAGTPSYLLFYMGEEKTRFLGHADALNLVNILVVDDLDEHAEIASSHRCLSGGSDPVPSIRHLLRRK